MASSAGRVCIAQFIDHLVQHLPNLFLAAFHEERVIHGILGNLTKFGVILIQHLDFFQAGNGLAISLLLGLNGNRLALMVRHGCIRHLAFQLNRNYTLVSSLADSSRPQYAASSSMRLANPHSLSNQMNKLARRSPLMRVSPLSMIAEFGL